MQASDRKFDLLDPYDVVVARQYAREMARALGFGLTDQTRIATAVSEVARRALQEAGPARIFLAVVEDGGRQGLECTCSGALWKDASGGPGRELGGVERLMDDLSLEPGTGGGIVVVMHKWLRQGGPNDRGVTPVPRRAT